MSAFFVSKADIDAIVTSAKIHGIEWPESPSMGMDQQLYHNMLGALLWHNNARSLRARYEDANENWKREFASIEGYTFKQSDVGPWQRIKCADCFDHQACEFDGYNESGVKKFVDAVIDAELKALNVPRGEPDTPGNFRNQNGWETAQWGLP